jgi:hypothetical protein
MKPPVEDSRRERWMRNERANLATVRKFIRLRRSWLAGKLIDHIANDAACTWGCGYCFEYTFGMATSCEICPAGKETEHAYCAANRDDWDYLSSQWRTDPPTPSEIEALFTKTRERLAALEKKNNEWRESWETEG